MAFQPQWMDIKQSRFPWPGTNYKWQAYVSFVGTLLPLPRVSQTVTDHWPQRSLFEKLRHTLVDESGKSCIGWPTKGWSKKMEMSLKLNRRLFLFFTTLQSTMSNNTSPFRHVTYPKTLMHMMRNCYILTQRNPASLAVLHNQTASFFVASVHHTHPHTLFSYRNLKPT